MSSHPFIYGIDFCFNAAEPGTQAPDGHYDLGCGFIQRGAENKTWQKVAGFSEDMAQNNKFGFTFFDMSRTVTSIDFVTISMGPGGDSPPPAGKTSPFSDSDEETLLKGQTLATTGAEASRGCGDGATTPTGNMFPAGEYVLKNEGDYKMTIQLRITDTHGDQIEFKCALKMRVGSD
jgi:hypothetical protein